MLSFEFTNFILHNTLYIGVYNVLYGLLFFIFRPSAFYKVLTTIIATAKFSPTVFICLS